MKAIATLADESDAQQFTDWQMSTADNQFDPAISTYPSLRTLRVDVNGEPAVYVPFHPVLLVESLGQRPGVDGRTAAAALLRAQVELEKVAKAYGMSEIWWMGTNEKLNAGAETRGYEVITTKVLRKKI